MEDEWVENPSLQDCECEHEPEDHDWGNCTVVDCPCQGHWEE